VGQVVVVVVVGRVGGERERERELSATTTAKR
jgi:hypothetical protein